MMNLDLDDYHANSQKNIGKIDGIGFYGLFNTWVFRVVWIKEQLCLSQMVYNLQTCGI